MPEVLATDSKTCRYCLTERSLREFRAHKQCVDGHVGRCRPCERALESEWRAKNRITIRRNFKSWREKNLDHVRAKQRTTDRARWRQRRESFLRRNYGIGVADYDAMLERQGGACAICFGSPEGRRGKLVVDHCHTTGRVRGLLCNKCNRGLGLFYDRPHALVAAARYIKAAK